MQLKKSMKEKSFKLTKEEIDFLIDLLNENIELYQQDIEEEKKRALEAGIKTLPNQVSLFQDIQNLESIKNKLLSDN